MKLSIKLMLAAFSASVPASPIVAQNWLPGQIASKRERDKAKILKLTAADFDRKATIKDDDLETIATIDTSNGFRSLGGLADLQRADPFLRAFVNKKDGSVTYQLYQTIWYQENVDRRYTSVNYLDSGTVKTAELTTLDDHVITCGEYSSALGCERVEVVTFPVSEDLIKRLAAQPVDQFWRFKFRATASYDWEEMMGPAEAAGLLLAIQRYKAGKGL